MRLEGLSFANVERLFSQVCDRLQTEFSGLKIYHEFDVCRLAHLVYARRGDKVIRFRYDDAMIQNLNTMAEIYDDMRLHLREEEKKNYAQVQGSKPSFTGFNGKVFYDGYHLNGSPMLSEPEKPDTGPVSGSYTDWDEVENPVI